MLKITTAIILSLLLLGAYIVFEPNSLNPFSQYEVPLTSSESLDICTTHPQHSNTELDGLLNQYLSSGGFLGAALGISIAGCDDYAGGGGLSNKGNRSRMTASTPMRTASITKPMTAVAIMQLFEQGLLELDAPIKRYLPNLRKKTTGDITIRQLLSHTSGIRHYTSPLDAMSFTHYASVSDGLSKFISDPLTSEPGSRYEYSSYGYSVLGAVIEELTGQSYGEYMRANIWDRAGMTNTDLVPRDKPKIASSLYLKVGSVFVRSPNTDLSIIYSAGGTQSTVADLLKFGQAILENKLISRQTLELMIDVQGSLSVIAGDSPYGLGWTAIDSSKFGRLILHSGSSPGAESFLAIYLEQSAVIAVLANAYSPGNEAYLLTMDVANATLSEEF
jgi:serine beta-lactamase-like protein LACTB